MNDGIVLAAAAAIQSAARMRRRLFTFASAVSALLCVATCVLWVHFRQDDEPRLGFKWGRFGYDRSQTTDLAAGRPRAWAFGVVVPFWSLAVIFSILPAWGARGSLVSRRKCRPGLCRACGYDLR